jgi:hypothetical protein
MRWLFLLLLAISFLLDPAAAQSPPKIYRLGI